MGTPALTTRGLNDADFEKVAVFFDRAVEIAVRLKNTEKGKKLKGFKEMCSVGPSVDPEVEILRNDVMEFACTFPTVGFDEDEMAYQGKYMLSQPVPLSDCA
jgi:glycine hydroxymethyltransferase